MGAWWRMMCDDGHQWELLEESDAEPVESDLRCPKDGLPAVTAMRLPLADRAVIEILPLAWEREGTAGRRDEYRLEISSRLVPDARLTSSISLSWDDAVRYAGMFKDTSWEQAEQRWKRIGRLSESAE